MSTTVVHPEPDEQEVETIHSKDGIVLGQWDIGLFSCWDTCVPNCMMSCLCPCVTLAQIYTRLGLLSYRKGLLCFSLLTCGTIIAQSIPHSQPTVVSTAYSTTITRTVTIWDHIRLGVSIILHLGFILAVWYARSHIRQRFQIDGEVRYDCCLSCCCTCCVMAQMATHIKSYTPGSCDFQPCHVLQAYQ